MYLIVGLGNPGEKYTNTRHNIGFMVIDHIAKVYSIKPDKKTSLYISGQGQIAGKEIILATPLTFMNNSGLAVRELAQQYGVAVDNIIVIYDDLDLDLGRVRIRKGGSSGGHRGVSSIISKLEEDDFIRIRIGIGRPPGRMDSADYVLSPFRSEEQEEIEFAIIKAADAVKCILESGLEKAMNEFNKRNNAEA